MAADTKHSRVVLEDILTYTINMTGLDTSGHHLPDKFINVILGFSLAQGGQAQITYETLHKVWSILCFYLL